MAADLREFRKKMECTDSTFPRTQQVMKIHFPARALRHSTPCGGSTGRGHRLQEPIHFRFGAQELSDQRDGEAWLKTHSYVDAEHIGSWGWSYGGHMTLRLMFEDSQDFKAGFAGGPVTNWHYYDSIYTERYIGLLPENEESYRASSPTEKAGQLKGQLLIAHGTGADTVHFANELEHIDVLI